mmetsp:Transcript_8136/g.25577  ORF Transcript_8136/g.25577 Transcript_8136/m.25577 type:complete len:263 (+) Transcript_8136:458-1246(+)
MAATHHLHRQLAQRRGQAGRGQRPGWPAAAVPALLPPPLPGSHAARHRPILRGRSRGTAAPHQPQRPPRALAARAARPSRVGRQHGPRHLRRAPDARRTPPAPRLRGPRGALAAGRRRPAARACTGVGRPARGAVSARVGRGRAPHRGARGAREGGGRRGGGGGRGGGQDEAGQAVPHGHPAVARPRALRRGVGAGRLARDAGAHRIPDPHAPRGGQGATGFGVWAGGGAATADGDGGEGSVGGATSRARPGTDGCSCRSAA